MWYSTFWTASFDVMLGESEFRYVKIFVEPQDATNTGGRKVTFQINPSNIKKWITLFKYLWSQLEGMLLESTPSQSNITPTLRNVRSTAPDEVSTQRITLIIACLHSLRHILRHLFFIPVPRFQRALAEAGML